MRLHVIPALGKVKLEKLTPQHVDAALTRMEAGVGAYSRTILRAALNKALKWGMVYRNAAGQEFALRPSFTPGTNPDVIPDWKLATTTEHFVKLK